METLENLGIKILPPTKMVARPFKIHDIDGEIYWSAEVSEFRDFWLEPVGQIFALTEEELKMSLKKHFNCDYMMERTLENFVQWYERIIKRELTEEETKKIVDKFVNSFVDK